MKLNKIERSPAQLAWKEARSDERWEDYFYYALGKLSVVTTMLPSQITHLKQTYAGNAQV